MSELGDWKEFYAADFEPIPQKQAVVYFERAMQAQGLTEMRNMSHDCTWDGDRAAWMYIWHAELR
jgi:hypothetical protein